MKFNSEEIKRRCNTARTHNERLKVSRYINSYKVLHKTVTEKEDWGMVDATAEYLTTLPLPVANALLYAHGYSFVMDEETKAIS